MAEEEVRGFRGGGPLIALRAYQHWHPNAAIYDVTYRGRSVWMTSNQQAIWHEVQKYWMRGKRDTLARIAAQVHCSRATVSRFLRRLDLWGFIDLATIRGRNGGVWIFTRPVVNRQDVYTKRQRYLDRVSRSVRLMRARMLEKLQPVLDGYWRDHPRAKAIYYQSAIMGEPQRLGKTGATFTDQYGRYRRLAR